MKAKYTQIFTLVLAVLFLTACVTAKTKPSDMKAAAPKPIAAAESYGENLNVTGQSLLQPALAIAPADSGHEKASKGATRKLDLGGGYTLEINAQGGQIVASQARFSAAPAMPSTQKLDIGGGYFLETSVYGGKVVAPEARFTSPVSVNRIDLGCGYGLVITDRGGQIVPPSTAPVVSTSTYTKRIELGGGYMLLIDQDGGRIVPAR